ncbi:hypothetical protein G3567_10895 [Psychroflexus sp. YR1-1]|uniref:Uncharacterized protein n=1 Tax=Psychroflexus aurantiacus TaxID=2709310 RepID=A0A6B3RAN8_9FLAO|nr:hypothetical protein [Psychroflexus aurantiacus]NEV94651.1 hypothetical protein [Psychroflexus aurantiacus]
MDISFEHLLINEFKVTRIHGINAFDELIKAQNLLPSYHNLLETAKNESHEEWMQNAGTTGSEIRFLEEQAFRHLSKAVILYQSSMEAIVALAESHHEGLATQLRDIKGFKNRWENALTYFDEPTKEFQKYESEFYKELRIPLTHLTPNRQDRLNKIKLISYKKVYNGFRNGWWSFLRLQRGLELTGDNFEDNWRLICERGLNHKSFMEDHPDNIE